MIAGELEVQRKMEIEIEKDEIKAHRFSTSVELNVTVNSSTNPRWSLQGEEEKCQRLGF